MRKFSSLAAVLVLLALATAARAQPNLQQQATMALGAADDDMVEVGNKWTNLGAFKSVVDDHWYDTDHYAAQVWGNLNAEQKADYGAAMLAYDLEMADAQDAIDAACAYRGYCLAWNADAHHQFDITAWQNCINSCDAQDANFFFFKQQYDVAWSKLRAAASCLGEADAATGRTGT